MLLLLCFLCVCYNYVSLKPIVSPNMFGLRFMESVVLSICNASCVLYSAESGVKRVHVVLSGFTMILLFVSMYVFPVSMIECLRLLCVCRCVLMLWLCRLRIS